MAQASSEKKSTESKQFTIWGLGDPRTEMRDSEMGSDFRIKVRSWVPEMLVCRLQ